MKSLVLYHDQRCGKNVNIKKPISMDHTFSFDHFIDNPTLNILLFPQNKTVKKMTTHNNENIQQKMLELGKVYL